MKKVLGMLLVVFLCSVGPVWAQKSQEEYELELKLKDATIRRLVRENAELKKDIEKLRFAKYKLQKLLERKGE